MVKKIILNERSQENLKNNKTLVFGENTNEFVLMPFSKYASLIVEADKDKIQARLKIESIE